MSKSRPTLNQLKRECPQDLAHCEGYVWHMKTKIGKGSFGEVFLGWSNDGALEVAVKVVRKEFFKQDPKVRENLEREIRILKLLRGCEYVVHLHHVQELKQCIVLVMELCDYDLDHLVKVEPFVEESVIVFLFQLGQGMKALRYQNIVHRDLKPGNILIKRHPKTGKMMIKLADFGFARHFKDEGNKIIDMTSLAGTPVFMAPEALSCVFHPGEHYDDKVDIWSIGALLYKVIVGQCGFYAQLQDIPRVLRHKGDAIAFERAHNRKINYIYELPPSVNNRLSESFRDKMKNLLCSMLKLDPRERMTFAEFFETVDDIIRSKVEVINVLHGTSFKVISDPSLTSDILIEKVHMQWKIPSIGQVIFSKNSPHFVAPNESLSHDQFVKLLEQSGGAKGHAKLYLLPLLQLDQSPNPDTSCLAVLKHSIEDPTDIINRVKEAKFADEIVHIIGVVGMQLRRQLEGLEELNKFAEKELSSFSSTLYPSLLEQGHQALAKVSLAIRWLNEDFAVLSNSQNQIQVSAVLSSMEECKHKLQQVLQEINEISSNPSPTLNGSIKDEDISKIIGSLSDRAKKLPNTSHQLVPSACRDISSDCEAEMTKITVYVRSELVPFSKALSNVWSMRAKSSVLLEMCSSVDLLISQALQERNAVLTTLNAGVVRDGKTHGAQATPVPVPIPPLSGWPNPSVSSNPTVDKLTREIEHLNKRLASAAEENYSLGAQVTHLKSATNAAGDVESTLTPAVKNLEDGNQIEVLDHLTEQLKRFCNLAESMTPETVTKEQNSSSTLYPMLKDYSVISMPGAEDDDLSRLIPSAQKLAASIGSCIPQLDRSASRVSSNSALVKIGRPPEYVKGDVVVFTKVNTIKTKSSVPALLHLQHNRPYILMDTASYNNFNIRPGRIPDIFLARLSDKPLKYKFEDRRELAGDLGQKTGEFFMVPAEPISLKFSAQRIGSSTQATGIQATPTRPARSPTMPAPLKHFLPKKHNKDFV